VVVKVGGVGGGGERLMRAEQRDERISNRDAVDVEFKLRSSLKDYL
jgi:hypothetical protein